MAPAILLSVAAGLVLFVAAQQTAPYFADPPPPREFLEQPTVVAFGDRTPALDTSLAVMPRGLKGDVQTALVFKFGHAVREVEFAVQAAPPVSLSSASVGSAAATKLLDASAFTTRRIPISRRGDGGRFQVQVGRWAAGTHDPAVFEGKLRARSYRYAQKEAFNELQINLREPPPSDTIVGDRAFVRPSALVVSQPGSGSSTSEESTWEFPTRGTEMISTSPVARPGPGIGLGSGPAVELRGSHLLIGSLGSDHGSFESGREYDTWTPPNVDLRVSAEAPRRERALLTSGAALGVAGGLVVEAALVVLRAWTRRRQTT